MACQLARWGLQATISNEEAGGKFPSFLPIVLDFDLLTDKEPAEENRVFISLVAERVRSLLDYDGELPVALVRRLLQTRRIVLIVDRLSELGGGTASLVFATENSSQTTHL